jgi:hypothetical protein
MWREQQPEGYKERKEFHTPLKISLEDMCKRRLKCIDGMHRVTAMRRLLEAWRKNQTPVVVTYEQQSKCEHYAVFCGWLYDHAELGPLVNILVEQSIENNATFVDSTYLDQVTAMMSYKPFHQNYLEKKYDDDMAKYAVSKLCVI